MQASSLHPAGGERTSVRQRHDETRRILWIVLVVNACVAATKLALGWSMDALSLTADGFHSVMDGSSNIVALVGLAAARRPPDADHPYGHARFETLAASGIGLLMGVTCLELAKDLLARALGSGSAPTPTWSGALVVLATIGVNLWVTRYERRHGERLGSALLLADAQHTLTDTAAASVVLMTFAATALGLRGADLIGATIVVAFIGLTAWRVLRSNIAVLADEVRLDPQQVRAVALSVDGVLRVEAVRSRGPADAVLLDLRIAVGGDLPLTEAHVIAGRVADMLRLHFGTLHDVMVHAVPSEGGPVERLVVHGRRATDDLER